MNYAKNEYGTRGVELIIKSAALVTNGTSRRRPLGVWLLAIVNALFGLPYFILVLNNFFDDPSRYHLEFKPYYLTFHLAIFTSIFVAWWGSNIARIAMLFLITMAHAWLVFGLLIDMRARGLENYLDFAFYTDWALIFISSMLLALNYWYFLGPRVRAFYGL